jgi:hypothetical protein
MLHSNTHTQFYITRREPPRVINDYRPGHDNSKAENIGIRQRLNAIPSKSETIAPPKLAYGQNGSRWVVDATMPVLPLWLQALKKSLDKTLALEMH